MIKVIIADDQIMLSESLKLIIEQDSDIKVVGLAQDGIEALKLCDETMPDIVLMDLRMPNCDGIESTAAIKKKYPTIKILVLTTFNDEESINKVMKNGADSYILKNRRPPELINSIKNIMNGINVIDNTIYGTVVNQMISMKSGTRKKDDIEIEKLGLNDQEKEVIKYIVQGKSNKEIASLMELSDSRIKAIISDVFIKLKVEDRTQLAIFAVKNHLN